MDLGRVLFRTSLIASLIATSGCGLILDWRDAAGALESNPDDSAQARAAPTLQG